MAYICSYLSFLTLLWCCLPFSYSFPDQGKWNFNALNVSERYFAVHKSLFKGSTISIKIVCDPSNPKDNPPRIAVGWALHTTSCYQDYVDIEYETQSQLASYYAGQRVSDADQAYFKPRVEELDCFHGIELSFQDISKGVPTAIESLRENGRPRKKRSENLAGAADSQRKDHAQNGSALVMGASPKASLGSSAKTANAGSEAHSAVQAIPTVPHIPGDVGVIPRDGIYLLIVSLTSVGGKNFTARVDLSMKGRYGYLSAVDWPFLPFYGVMCGIYVLYAVGWLVVSALQWRDLLRIQFWIGGVIFLGMLEKAVFYAEYQSINYTGYSVQGAVLFAEVLSSLKRSLARLLVIVVSLGFGIVKPRLGPMLHRVIIVGGIYFILASVEGCIRTLKPKNAPGKEQAMLSIGLAIVDSGICWWIFSSLVQTTRTLRLRRNVIKLSLYRHFTNTLIFAVLASVVFMVWMTFYHRAVDCLTDWKELWFDEGYWQLLFSIVLLVIMFLWRPTNNNQRYAFTPLLDAADDEEKEDMLQPQNDAFEGMKMRGSKGNPAPSREKDRFEASAEDDLKWVEETIPSSLGETALPSLLDSDEEIMTVRFEQNKME